MSSPGRDQSIQTHSTGIGDSENTGRTSGRLAGRHPIPPLDDPEQLLHGHNDTYVTPLANDGTRDTNITQEELFSILREVAGLREELQSLRGQAPTLTVQSTTRTPEVTSGITVKAVYDIFDLPVIGPWDPNNQKGTSYEYFKEQLLAQTQLYGINGVAGVHYMMRCVSGKLKDDIRKWTLEGVSNLKEIFRRLDDRFSTEWQQQTRWFRWETRQLDQQRGEKVREYVTRLETEAESLRAMPGESISDMEIRARFIRGLHNPIRQSLRQHIGPKVVSLEETIEIAKFYDYSDEQHGYHQNYQQNYNQNKGFKDNTTFSRSTTRPTCKFYLRGHCAKGSACRFPHTNKYNQRQSTSTSDNTSDGNINNKANTNVDKPKGYCYEFKNTGSCSRDNCIFAHIKQENPNPNTTAAVMIDSNTMLSEDGSCMAITSNCIPQPKCQVLTANIGICLEGQVQARQICSLLDTGSNVNLCSSALIKRLECQSDVFTTNESPKYIRLADGKNEIQYIGNVTLKCSTPSAQAAISFIVVPTLAYELVLGTGALTTLGIHICFSKDTNKPNVTSGHNAIDNTTKNPSNIKIVDDNNNEDWEDKLNDGLLSCGISFEPINSTIYDKTFQQSSPPTTTSQKTEEKRVPFSDPLLINILPSTSTSTKHSSFPILEELPWLTEDRPKNNLREALGRARSLERSLSLKEHAFAQEALQTLLEEGHIELCKPNDILYYLPIHVVYKPGSISSATRLTVDGRELNRYLKNGSLEGCLSLNHNLTTWRLSPAYTSLDLSRAFHSIKLQNNVSSYCGGYLYGCHFKWLSLPFGLCCSSSSLHQTLCPIIKSIPVDSPVVWYVDDIGVTAKTLNSLKANESAVIKYLTKHGFHLQDKKRVSTGDTGIFEHFGYNWSLSSTCDEIVAQLPPLIKSLYEDPQLQLTKRQLLAAYATWFDCMGIFPSIGVRSRLNMQAAHNDSTSWDDEVHPKHIDNFKCWCKAIVDCKPTIIRSLSGEYLYMYCDASEAAWSSVAYCPIFDLQLSSVQCNKPLQPLRGSGGVFGTTHSTWTIPKKELYSLFRACELLREIRDVTHTLDIRCSEWVIFSDSAISIYRIKTSRNDTKLSSLETRWVTYIRDTCINLNVRIIHVSSANNLADAPSRGIIQPPNALIPFTLSSIRSSLDGSAVVEHSPTLQTNNVNYYDRLVCYAINETNVNDDEEEEVSVQEEIEIPFLDNVQIDDIIQHQHQSALYKNIRLWLEQGGHWSTLCTLPRSFLEREAPLYALQNNVLYRITSVDANGTCHPKIALDHSDVAFIHKIIDKTHNDMGHLGSDKFITLLEERYHCLRFKVIIRSRLKTCDECQRIHAVRHHKKFWSRLHLRGLHPAQVLAVDIMAMHPNGIDPVDPRSRPYTCVLTVTCSVSKFTWLRCLKSYSITAITTTLDILLGDIGYPVALVFDGAATQTPWTLPTQHQKLKAWAAKKLIQIAVLPPYARGYAGWYEACHKFVRKALQADFLTGHKPESWPERIPNYQLVMNSTPYDSQSSLSPLYLLYAYTGKLPCDLPLSSSEESLLLSGIQHLLNPYERQFLCKLNEESVKLNEVLVYVPTVIGPNFTGPYKIVEQLSGSTCRINPIGGHGMKNISPIQLYANLTRYYSRTSDPSVTSWIQCDNCGTWRKTDSLLVSRFRNTRSRFHCRLLGERCNRSH